MVYRALFCPGRPASCWTVGCFSLCLRESRFPSAWKIARLVLLKKRDKPENQPSSFRPICLDEAGKLFDRVIAERLREHLDEVDGLSPDQFGFRRGSTIDAIL